MLEAGLEAGYILLDLLDEGQLVRQRVEARIGRQLVRRISIYWLPLCASQRCQSLLANYTAYFVPNDYSKVLV